MVYFITTIYTIDWNEDFITRDLLRSLRSQIQSRISVNIPPIYDGYYIEYPFCLGIWTNVVGTVINIEWNAYKQTGRNETDFGDIAVLVLAQYRDGDRVEGVGFLEAKKRNEKALKFGAIRVEQLKRIFRHAPRAVMLFYDYEPVNFLHPDRPLKWGQTFATTVPIDLVLATGKRDISIYKFSKPFSHQLLSFLMGFELERTKRALDIAKGLESRFGIPRHLLVMRVGIDTDTPPEDIVQFNRNRYEPVE